MLKKKLTKRWGAGPPIRRRSECLVPKADFRGMCPRPQFRVMCSRYLLISSGPWHEFRRMDSTNSMQFQLDFGPLENVEGIVNPDPDHGAQAC